MKMKAGYILVAVSVIVCLKLTEACKGKPGREFDFDLANFFENCPQLRQAAVGILPSLQSVIDYIIRDTAWYKEIKEGVCVGPRDVASCWINALPILLKDDSPFETPAAQCVCDWGGTCWAPDIPPKKMEMVEGNVGKEIKIPSKSFSSCLKRSMVIFESQDTSLKRFDADSISVFLQDHYSYCRTVPTIPIEEWCLVPMLYVNTFCPTTGPDSAWRDDLLEVYNWATRTDVFLRNMISSCALALTTPTPPPATPKPERVIPPPSIGCKPSAVLVKCESACPATCKVKPYPCSIQCDSEYVCGCPKGYIQLSLENKECVEEGECPRTCEDGKIFQACPSLCQPTCDNPNPLGCQRGCNPINCVCPLGLVKPNEESDECISLSACSKRVPTGTGGQVTQGAEWSNWMPISRCSATCGPNLYKEERRNCRFPDGRNAPVSLCGGVDTETRRYVSCGPTECPTRYLWTAWKCQRNTFGPCRDVRSCWMRVGAEQYQQVRPQSLCGQVERPNPSCFGC